MSFTADLKLNLLKIEILLQDHSIYKEIKIMDNIKFNALVVEELEKNIFSRKICEKSIDDLPDGDVLIKVH